MLTWIVSLYLIGLALVLAETLLPGMILGLAAAGCLIGCVYLSYAEFGALGLAISSIASVVGTVGVAFGGLKLLPHTPFGRAMMNSGATAKTAPLPEANAALLGQKGETVTTLSPGGLVEIAGRSYEATSRDGLLTKGTRVTVVGREDFRLVVSHL